ncbi:MAG: protein translocase subunit SecF, partial [Bdellovibrionales bacterium]|nr:protein translocase subunit SecF [Bdellovibrionales bacterium]
MELVSSELRLDYMRWRFLWVAISLALIGLSIFSWVRLGPEKYGVDFVGGADVIVLFEKPVAIGDIRQALDRADISGASVQAFEGDTHEFSIRLKAARDADIAQRIDSALEKIEGNSFQILKQDFVGPVIGEQIRQNGVKALVIAILCLLVYISFRFEWRFAVGAIAALVHDIVVAAGIYVMSGREISASTLAALLTILGYSLNDTIIIYDRVRENVGLAQRGERRKKAPGHELASLSFIDLVNLSVNQTMSRTILTSLTTFFVVLMLYLMGGGEI